MSNPNKNAVDLTDLIKDKFTMRKDIAPVETSATASRAYKVGDKFYYGNLLQEATQDIAQGGTLTLNTNYKNADPVTTSIQNLSNQVNNVYMYDFTQTWIHHLTITTTLTSGASIKICTQLFDLKLETSASSLHATGPAILSTSANVPITYSQSGLTFNLNTNYTLNGVIISNIPLTVTTSKTSSPEANTLETVNLPNLSTHRRGIEIEIPGNKKVNLTYTISSLYYLKIWAGKGGLNGFNAEIVGQTINSGTTLTIMGRYIFRSHNTIYLSALSNNARGFSIVNNSSSTWYFYIEDFTPNYSFMNNVEVGSAISLDGTELAITDVKDLATV